ncbi:MAG: hypothetical protein RMJ51_03900 [Candidatus Calescibacterium sp.]|nr:hypothetical protein [Candidatus Calescibacterium sp.]MCX7971763.1 hypothetical protein [bacterium]MDW8195369.1 hypothetical protein [Candidatus Calescibacterium sp.]
MDFCRKKGFNFSIYIFTTDTSIVNHRLRIFEYSYLRDIAYKVGAGFIINFAGFNVFRALFSLHSYEKKNRMIWSSRIDFTKSIVDDLGGLANNFVFILPSAVWVYSKFLRDYFLTWESTITNQKHLVFRLGVVLSKDCQWVSIMKRLLSMGIYPEFPSSFLFPYVCANHFMEVLLDNIVNFTNSRILDCFKVITFNQFVKFLENYWGYRDKFLKVNSFITGFLIKSFFRDYGRVFDSLDISLMDTDNLMEVQKCFIL